MVCKESDLVPLQYSEQSQDIFTNKLEELHGNFELKFTLEFNVFKINLFTNISIYT